MAEAVLHSGDTLSRALFKRTHHGKDPTEVLDYEEDKNLLPLDCSISELAP